MGQFFIGITLLAAGAFLVIKTEWFIYNIGRITWFEANLGSDGGSRLGYKLVGLILIFIGVVVITGGGDSFMLWLLSPLLKHS